MNYLSDDENDETLQQQNLEEVDEIEDDEIDEETRRIIFNSVRDPDDDDFFSGCIKKAEPKKSQPKKDNKKKSMSLEEMVALQKQNEPKKWESTRAESKKKKINIVKEVKRSFNPRLPPYKTMIRDKVKTETKKIENNEENFPSLGVSAQLKPAVTKLNFKSLVKKE